MVSSFSVFALHPPSTLQNTTSFGNIFLFSHAPKWSPPGVEYGLTSPISTLFETFYNLAPTVCLLVSQIMLAFYLASASPTLLPFSPPTEVPPVHPSQISTFVLRLSLMISREKNYLLLFILSNKFICQLLCPILTNHHTFGVRAWQVQLNQRIVKNLTLCPCAWETLTNINTQIHCCLWF